MFKYILLIIYIGYFNCIFINNYINKAFITDTKQKIIINIILLFLMYLFSLSCYIITKCILIFLYYKNAYKIN